MSNTKPWHDQYPEYWPKDIDYPDISVPELLRRRTEEFSDKDAIIYEGNTYTYEDLQRNVDEIATGLSELGIGRGDHVSLCMPNCPQFPFAFYAVLTLGGVTVHTSFMYTEDELERQLTDSEATAILTLDTYAGKVANVVEDTPVETVIVTSLADYLSPAVGSHVSRANERLVRERGWHWLDEVQDKEADPPRPEIAPDDLASLPYTGGTTGFPKGVRITHENWVSEAAMGELVDLVAYEDPNTIERGEQTITGLMPMFHINGNLSGNLTSVYNGSRVILYSEFDPQTVLRDIEQYGITHMHTVPTMLTGLLNQADIETTDFSSLRHVLVASAPVPTETKEQFEQITGAATFEGFGQTEVAMGCTMETPTMRREGSCGIPVPGVDVDIFDVDTDERLPAGEVGEIVVRSENNMDGYWKRPEKTDETIRDGWLHTGDLGYRDEDWFFYHVDRKDDMIITSGHNVYPAEVEDVLYDNEHVKEAAVIGIEDEYRGKKVAAFIETDADIDPQTLEEELDTWCREELANYKVPRHYEFRDLPRTDVGKISRQTLKEEVNAEV